MMTRLLNPVASAVIALLLSLAIGVGMTWRSLSVVVERVAKERAHKEPSEFKKKGWDFWTIEIDNLAGELKDEREMMKKRVQELDQREARIAAAEKELAKARADLNAMRKEISDRVLQISADESVNLKKLSQNYASLTPKAVVAIMREMDDNTAAKILSLMKSDAFAPILEEMSKSAGTDGPMARRAAILTEKLRLMSNTPAKPATSP